MVNTRIVEGEGEWSMAFEARRPKTRLWMAVTQFFRCSGAWLLVVGSGCLSAPLATQEVVEPALVGGYWQSIDGSDYFLGVEGQQILIASNGRVRDAATILKPAPGGVLVCREGYEALLQVRRAGDELEVFDHREQRVRNLRRAAAKPAALSLSLVVAEPAPITEERMLAIQREVRLRFRDDQSSFRQYVRGEEEPPWLKDQSDSQGTSAELKIAELTNVDRFGKNGEFMRELLTEVGWVDARRFGYPASTAAFFLVQHSWDIPLMLSVLPWIKEDAVAGLVEGSLFALMFDRSQIALGRPQRFGSQIIKKATGEVIVLPLEKPDEVDIRRQRWGLPPLRDYVGVFGASEVRLSTECSLLTSPAFPVSSP